MEKIDISDFGCEDWSESLQAKACWFPDDHLE